MQNHNYLALVRCFTYNHSAYITEALTGFVEQKTNFPYIVVVVDDASTDGAQDIIRKFVEEQFDVCSVSAVCERETDYGHFSYARHKNNLNCYIATLFLKENHYQQRKSKLPYLKEWEDKVKYHAICEGDDYWIDSLKLQKQVQFLEEHPDFFLCGTNGWIKYNGIDKKDVLFNKINISRELLPKEIIGHWMLPTAGLLFRKDIYVDYPAWTRKVYSGDQTLILLSMNKGRIYALSDVCSVYRRDAANKSSVSMLVRKTKSRAYVVTQHIILYNEFNKYTEGRYAYLIEPLLKNLMKQECVYRLMDRSVLLAALRYPITFSSIVLNKYKRSR